MSKTVLTEGDEGVRLIVKEPKHKEQPQIGASRSPVHVVYGGADIFSVDTPRKLGRIALDSMKQYAPNFSEFARAFQLHGFERLPSLPKAIKEREAELRASPEKLKRKDPATWFAWAVYQKTVEKLRREPVEDFRIDFEDGYGFRSEAEEDGHAESAAIELASAFKKKRITPFSGFRIKSLGPETYGRAVKTLEIFLNTLLDQTSNKLPENFVVTLPKVTERKQVKELGKRLSKFEKERSLCKNSIGIELMIETPGAVFDKKGRVAIGGLVDAAKGRCKSVHFGAYDYTSALKISASHQDIRHPACDFARSVIQIGLAGSGIRLADSVTTIMPVAVHKKEELSVAEKAENKRTVHSGWLRHFQNVSASMANGFYQSWDLHPNQLAARYAAVYAFFLGEMDANAQRLRNYSEKATKATLTGNTFDDAASVAGLVNFFRRGLDCGAFEEAEIRKATGLSSADLDQSFVSFPGQ
jgi:citrate lyase beta subunit